MEARQGVVMSGRRPLPISPPGKVLAVDLASMPEHEHVEDQRHEATAAAPTAIKERARGAAYVPFNATSAPHAPGSETNHRATARRYLLRGSLELAASRRDASTAKPETGAPAAMRNGRASLSAAEARRTSRRSGVLHRGRLERQFAVGIAR